MYLWCMKNDRPLTPDLTYSLAQMKMDECKATESIGYHAIKGTFGDSPLMLRHIARHNLRELSMNKKKEN